MGAQWHSLRSLQVCKDEAWGSWEKHGVKLSDEEGCSARLGTYTFWWSLTRFRRTLICKRNAGGWQGLVGCPMPSWALVSPDAAQLASNTQLFHIKSWRPSQGEPAERSWQLTSYFCRLNFSCKSNFSASRSRMVCHSSLALSLWEETDDVSVEGGCGSKGMGQRCHPLRGRIRPMVLQAPCPVGPCWAVPRVCRAAGTRVSHVCERGSL